MLKKRKKLKVKKLRGGGSYQGGRQDTPSYAAKAGPVERPGGNVPQGAPKSVQSNLTPSGGNNFSASNFMMPTKLGMAVAGLKAVENARRAKRAKGEFMLSRKTTPPVTREFYRTVGRPLQTKIGSADKDFLKASGVTGGPKPYKAEERNNEGTMLCPDGSLPPCVPIKKMNRGGLSGGVKSGPPPKRGPNPQGLKKGGMTCPHRPDGIRGHGAAIKGFKFTGVK